MLDSKPEEINNTSYKALNEDLKCRVGEKRWKMIYILIWRNLVVLRAREAVQPFALQGLGAGAETSVLSPGGGGLTLDCSSLQILY